MSHIRVAAYVAIVVPLLIVVSGQDAAVVNPKIVKVEFENQKSPDSPSTLCHCTSRLEMHSHLAKAEVQITDGTLRIFTPEGNGGTTPAKPENSFGSNRRGTWSKMSGAKAWN